MAALVPKASELPVQPAERCSSANSAVDGRAAPPGVGTVHDVVVDQRAGMQQLE